MLEAYDGSCHCGRVRFRVRADLVDHPRMQLLGLHEKRHPASDCAAGAFRAAARRGANSRPTSSTPTPPSTPSAALRDASLLRAAVGPGQDQRQCPLSRRNRSRVAATEALFRRAKLGRGTTGTPRSRENLRVASTGSGVPDRLRRLGEPARVSASTIGVRLRGPGVIGVEPGDLVLIEQRRARPGCGRSAPGSGSRSPASRARPNPSAGCTSDEVFDPDAVGAGLVVAGLVRDDHPGQQRLAVRRL